MPKSVELVRLRMLRVRAGVVEPLTGGLLLMSSLPGKEPVSVSGEAGDAGDIVRSDGNSKGRLG
jgi:hypothetical protein